MCAKPCGARSGGRGQRFAASSTARGWVARDAARSVRAGPRRNTRRAADENSSGTRGRSGSARRACTVPSGVTTRLSAGPNSQSLWSGSLGRRCRHNARSASSPRVSCRILVAAKSSAPECAETALDSSSCNLMLVSRPSPPAPRWRGSPFSVSAQTAVVTSASQAAPYTGKVTTGRPRGSESGARSSATSSRTASVSGPSVAPIGASAPRTMSSATGTTRA